MLPNRMLAFSHIWKTAGTTYTLLLRRHFGIRHFDRPGFRHRLLTARDLRRLRRVYPGLKSIGGHPVRPVSDLEQADPEIRYHTFLRDPLKRSISHFTWFLRWKAHDGVLFDDFRQTLREWAAAEENRNLQCRFLSRNVTASGAWRTLTSKPFLALRVEEFDASLLLFRDWAGEPDMDLRYRARNTHRDRYERLQDSNPEYLERVRDFSRCLREDEGLRYLIREANREDAELVGRVAEELWPRQVAAYAGDLDKDTATLREQNRTFEGQAREPVLARLHRNAVFKPLRPLLLPTGEDPRAEASPWL